MYVWANVKHRIIEPIPSSTALASICLSTGLVSAGIFTAGMFRVERPFRSRRNDSRSDFLNDFRREIVSPAPVKSFGFNVHFCNTERLFL